MTTLPQDISDLNKELVTQLIKDACLLPLSKIRKNQDIAYKQMNEESTGYSFCKSNPQGLRRLTIMLSIYQAAVDVVEFGDCTPEKWADSVMVEVESLTQKGGLNGK